MSEIQQIEEINLNFLDSSVATNPEVINFAKFKKIARIISEIQRYQQTNYCFVPVSSIQNYLLNLRSLSKLEISALAQVTHFREEVLSIRTDAELFTMSYIFNFHSTYLLSN